jgi:hypothetical protein
MRGGNVLGGDPIDSTRPPIGLAGKVEEVLNTLTPECRAVKRKH